MGGELPSYFGRGQWNPFELFRASEFLGMGICVSGIREFVAQILLHV